jgi:DNA-binding MarR family transcriptional regulator
MIVPDMSRRVTPSKRDADRPGAEIDPLRLDLQLCFALYAATADVVRLYRPHLDELGLTYPQYLVMMLLWEQAPRTVGGLGEALGLDSATLTPLLKRLEARRYVRRRRDPDDERRVLVEPTTEGRCLRARAVEVPAAVSCRIPMSVDDLVALREDLKTLRGALGNAAPPIEAAPATRRRARR